MVGTAEEFELEGVTFACFELDFCFFSSALCSVVILLGGRVLKACCGGDKAGRLPCEYLQLLTELLLQRHLKCCQVGEAAWTVNTTLCCRSICSGLDENILLTGLADGCRF